MQPAMLACRLPCAAVSGQAAPPKRLTMVGKCVLSSRESQLHPHVRGARACQLSGTTRREDVGRTGASFERRCHAIRATSLSCIRECNYTANAATSLASSGGVQLAVPVSAGMPRPWSHNGRYAVWGGQPRACDKCPQPSLLLILSLANLTSRYTESCSCVQLPIMPCDGFRAGTMEQTHWGSCRCLHPWGLYKVVTSAPLASASTPGSKVLAYVHWGICLLSISVTISYRVRLACRETSQRSFTAVALLGDSAARWCGHGCSSVRACIINLQIIDLNFVINIIGSAKLESGIARGSKM
jgi:hypothetical protein